MYGINSTKKSISLIVFNEDFMSRIHVTIHPRGSIMNGTTFSLQLDRSEVVCFFWCRFGGLRVSFFQTPTVLGAILEK